MSSFPCHWYMLNFDIVLTNFLLNSPISNRLHGTSRVLSRKSQNMTCVSLTIVLWHHDADPGVDQNKNAGSGGDGEDDEEQIPYCQNDHARLPLPQPRLHYSFHLGSR